MKYKRVFLLVFDAFGIGGEEGINTLKNIKNKTDFYTPNLDKLGFNNLINNENEDSDAYYALSNTCSHSINDLSNYGELFGLADINYNIKDFINTGFPPKMVKELEILLGHKIIGNVICNNPNTVIERLGEEATINKALIIYTTSNSSLEISYNEKLLKLNEGFKIGQKIRDFTMTNKEYLVSRVVVKPFKESKNNYTFIEDFKYYYLDPPSKIYTEDMLKNKLDVISIGKITSILNEKGINRVIKTNKSNKDALNKLSNIMEKNFTGLCITSIDEFSRAAKEKDFDYYKRLLEEFDVEVPLILNKLNNDDLLIITSVRGNDIIKQGFSYTKEALPVIIYSRIFNECKRLEDFKTIGDIAATISSNFEITTPLFGKNIIDNLK